MIHCLDSMDHYKLRGGIFWHGWIQMFTGSQDIQVGRRRNLKLLKNVEWFEKAIMVEYFLQKNLK